MNIDFQLYAPAALVEDKVLDQLHAELTQVLQKGGIPNVTTTIVRSPPK